MMQTSDSQIAASGYRDWRGAAEAVLARIDATAAGLTSGFPHWADAATGKWTTTSDGDWTGGAWPGMLWLAGRATGEGRYHDLARDYTLKLRPRVRLRSAFKGFGFYYGAALGEILAGDAASRALALECAEHLAGLFDPRLGLIPLGADAEESEDVGPAFSSVDSLQAAPLLYWAAEQAGNAAWGDIASAHTHRVLDIHMRADGSIVQSSQLDPVSGAVARRFTHKGYSDTSIWGRAQGWGLLYATMAAARRPDDQGLIAAATRAADWWLANLPADHVAYWDFDDPAIPAAPRDTAATAIVTAGLLKLGALVPEPERRRYRLAAERQLAALASTYLTAEGDDARPRGMLVGACFNKRPDTRPSDAAWDVEVIFGSYFFFEALQVLNGVIAPNDI